MSFFALNGLSGHLDLPTPNRSNDSAGALRLNDPKLSILFGDLHGLPEILFITSGRDMLLSGTALLQCAFLRAGNAARRL